MSTVTPLLNLVKPTTAEQFSLATYNNNLDLIDAKAAQYSEAQGTINGTNYDFRQSTFTRIRLGATQGIVVTELIIIFKTAVSIPANNAASLLLSAAVCPPGYRPNQNIGLLPSAVSAAGASGGLEVSMNSSGDVNIRSFGAGFTTTVNSQTEALMVYRWDGSLT